MREMALLTIAVMLFFIDLDLTALERDYRHSLEFDCQKKINPSFAVNNRW